MPVEAVQQRTVRVLVGAQVAGGLGVSTAIAVGALLATQVLGNEDLAGLVLSAMVLGSAVLAVPAASLASSHGRRAGLGSMLALSALGGVLVVVSAEVGSFLLLLAGVTLFGGGITAGLQARYAAVDLATDARRGRSLSIVVWATTVGAVLGPNLAEGAGAIGSWMRIEPLAGPFLLGSMALALAAGVVWFGLRPDPLLLSQELGRDEPAEIGEPPQGRGGVLRRGLSAAAGSPPALLGLLAMVVAHTVMVSVMVMTPIHMDHGHASLRVIGLVISVHIAGMYAFSPVMGWLADRIGRTPTILGGAATLGLAVALAGSAPQGHSAGLTAGLFLLGLGWSAILVAGSTLVTESVHVDARPATQGTSDLMMGLAAATGGGLSGVVVSNFGYGALNLAAGSLLLILLGVAMWTRIEPASS